jgi:hypothetical protein
MGPVGRWIECGVIAACGLLAACGGGSDGELEPLFGPDSYGDSEAARLPEGAGDSEAARLPERGGDSAEDPPGSEPAAAGDDAVGPARRSASGLGSSPPPAGPARLSVKLLLGNEEVPGRVRVLSASGETVKEGRAGQTFSVPAGRYVLEGEITDESVLADTPTKRGESFELAAGERRTEAVELGRSRIKLKVLRRGREVRDAKVKLRRKGGERVILELTVGDEYLSISPGRYDATVEFGNNRVEVDGLIFQGGATQTIPVRVQ